MITRYDTNRRCGLTMVEVIIATAILMISAASILNAFVAGSSSALSLEIREQSSMLASNILEEIRTLPAFEGGVYDDDTISLGTADSYLEADDDASDPGRSEFDDKTDFHNYQDGTVTDKFYNYDGGALPLFSTVSSIPPMLREVKVMTNDLGGMITDASQHRIEVEVTVYVQSDGDGGGQTKLVPIARRWALFGHNSSDASGGGVLPVDVITVDPQDTQTLLYGS